MLPTPIKIKSYVRKALADDQLRKAVRKATDTALISRQKAVDQSPGWELLRRRAHAYKTDIIENRDHYLDLFEEKCSENKIKVHRAADGREAVQMILNVARENNVRKIVKSKSLTTEEIQLNPALEKNGIETIETDLGEYIVQLEEKIPSHLTMPALHLSREDIGKLFTEKLKVPYTDEPSELLDIARKKLRAHFLSADMGITGVNFAMAEDGCFAVIENEGNAHLCLSLPKIHVAVMGIEKLIPHLAALPVFLKLLAPSATGQMSSSYVNIVGGAQRGMMGEGPEQVHIVLLDNGRSRIGKDPELRETLFCIRCGACLNGCPVYQQTGGHAYGWVYMGPIGAALIPQYLGVKQGRHAPFLCSLCLACADYCPLRIRLPDHLLTLRSRIVEKGYSGFMEKTGMRIWSILAARPRFYRLISQAAAFIQKLLPGKASFPAPGYTRERSLGRLDSRGFRKRFIKNRKANSNQE